MAVCYSMSSVTVKDGQTKADFVVKRTGTTTELNASTSVSYSTQDVSAKAGTDYVATSGRLDFAAGATEQAISVGIIEEAYQSKATLTFLLHLEGFGSATGSIVPSTSGEDKQSYLYVPEDDTLTRVPTTDNPGDNLEHQANYENFSDPTQGDTQLDRPLAYLRLGYARADLNYYERIILDTDTYHPAWMNGDADPVEPGAMEDFMLPRAINRIEDDDVSKAEENNKHLDGILIYSDKNYNVTVGGQATTVVQGDYVQEVEGRGRINWRSAKIEWIFAPPDKPAVAAGATTINGIPSTYQISWARNLSVTYEIQLAYSFAAKYTASAAAELTISNAVKYSVTNSIALDVKGVQIAANCDILGNFQLTTPRGDVMSTKRTNGLAASDEINLSIQAGTSKAWTAAVATAAAANAAAAALVSSTAAAATFAKGEAKSATPSGLETWYSGVVADALPDTCAALSAATAGILIAAAVAQAIAEELPTPMPKIEMTPEAMTLSVGPLTTMTLTTEGIVIAAPTVNVQTGGVFDVTAMGPINMATLASMNMEASEVGIAAPETTMLGNLSTQDINALNIMAFQVETVV